jgi:hypothetical protein
MEIVPNQLLSQPLDIMIYGILALVTTVLMLKHHFTQKTYDEA